MRIRTRALVAGSGLAVVLACAVPAIALADSGSTGTPSAGAATCPARDRHQAVATYLRDHPDVAQELKTIKALPADQRPAARKQYLAANPDVKSGLAQLRGQVAGDWAAQLGAAGDFLAAHPDVAALLDQVRSAPDGQRQQAAQSYLAAHPGTQAQLRAGATAARQLRKSCAGTGN